MAPVTENNELEKEIREREELRRLLQKERDTFRRYLDVAGVMIVALDGAGCVTLINKKGCEILGYPCEDILGKNWFENFVPQREREQVHRVFLQIIGGHADPVEYYENAVLTKAGEERLIAWHNTWLPDETGAFIESLSSGEDITEKRLAEEGAKQTQERLELALEGSELGLWDWSVPTGKAVWSGQTWQMLGYAHGEIQEDLRHWKALIHPDDWPQVAKAFNGHLQGHLDSYACDYRMKAKSGEWRWVQSRGRVVQFDSEGKPLRFVGTNLDITDRKRAEQELKEQTRLSQVLLDAFPCVALLLRPQTREIVASNKAAKEVGAVPGACCYSTWGQREDPCPWCLAPELWATGEAQHLEVEGLGVIWDAHWIPVDEDLYMHFAFDVTERKRADQEREVLKAHLLQAQKMEAIGTLSGGIAHDFNNLLTIINGYAEMLLLDKTEDDPSYEDLRKILQTGRKGAEMVQRLLAFSKQGEINPQPIDLSSMIQETKKLLKRTFPKMIEIETIVSDDVGMINADAGQIEQVLMNLCMNAREAMPDGGRLTIEVRNSTLEEDYCRSYLGIKPGDCVLLAVSDTGKGMDQETMLRIFDPFFTTRGWDSRKGSGLGLSLTKGLVEQHGGWITCYSEPGLGTTFKVYLPALKAEEQPEEAAVTPSIAVGSETILLVDDEEHVRDLGSRLLARSGYTVITARNGREALEIYSNEQGSISLVILDLIMPEMGGSKCLEELLKINPQVKVIISSGYSLGSQERSTVGAHAKAFVEKPYEMQQLLNTVRKVLDGP
jgi:PAS domain S-box-containing protein